MLPATLKQSWMTTALAVCLGMTLAGCNGGAVDAGDLPGTYRAAYDFGTEELTVRSDDTYEQAFAETGGTPVSINRGRWTLERGDTWDRTVLVLHDAVGLADVFGNRSDPARKTAAWRLPVRRKGDQLRLVINEDIGLAFVRR